MYIIMCVCVCVKWYGDMKALDEYRMYVDLRVIKEVCMCVCTHTYMCVYRICEVCERTYIHTYIHTYTHTYMPYTHTYTHTYRCKS